MINHARTLLLNAPGQTSQRQEIGEEYVPPNFVPLVLPSYLQTPRRVIFGAAPDRYFLNFRVRELMAHIHQTELAEYVTALDPRVTYWPEIARPFYDNEKRLIISQFSGSPASPPSFHGDLFADMARGRAARKFTLSVAQSGGVWTATIQTPDRPGELDTATLTFTDNLSQTIPLEDTGLVFKLARPLSAAAWTIDTMVKPAPVITTALPVLELLGEPLFLELFGVDDKTEPYGTFKRLWFDHKTPVYRMAGFTLAMIYRTHDFFAAGAKQKTTG